MRGHIIKRYKGSYSIVINLGIDPATGRRKQQWVSVKGTKKDAEKKLAELLHQLDTGSFVKPGKTTLTEFLERWLVDYVRPNLAPRTLEGYSSIIYKHLIPSLGNVGLTQIKPEQIQRFYSDMRSHGRCDGNGPLKPTTVSHLHTCLHRALEQALQWGLINHNPADSVVPPRPQRSEMQTMSEDDVRRLLEVAKRTPYYAVFYTALFTGMRRSELLALRWVDVDLLLAQIYVSRSLHHLRDHSFVYRTPKTAKGRRVISLSPSAALVLRRHQEEREKYCVEIGFPFKQEEPVFCQFDGKPLLPGSVSQAWTKAIRRAGLTHYRLHDSRHTHASLLLKQNVHPKVVQERLGHATISTTLDLYSHVVPGLQEAAAAKFDELIVSDGEKKVLERIG